MPSMYLSCNSFPLCGGAESLDANPKITRDTANMLRYGMPKHCGCPFWGPLQGPLNGGWVNMGNHRRGHNAQANLPLMPFPLRAGQYSLGRLFAL